MTELAKIHLEIFPKRWFLATPHRADRRTIYSLYSVGTLKIWLIRFNWRIPSRWLLYRYRKYCFDATQWHYSRSFATENFFLLIHSRIFGWHLHFSTFCSYFRFTDFSSCLVYVHHILSYFSFPFCSTFIILNGCFDSFCKNLSDISWCTYWVCCTCLLFARTRRFSYAIIYHFCVRVCDTSPLAFFLGIFT